MHGVIVGYVLDSTRLNAADTGSRHGGWAIIAAVLAA